MPGPRRPETYPGQTKNGAASSRKAIVSGRAAVEPSSAEGGSIGDGFPRWEVYVRAFVHPVKVAIIEALWCIGAPLSASQLIKLFSGQGESFRESNLRYHLGRLVKIGVLEVVSSSPFIEGDRADKFFYFPAIAPAHEAVAIRPSQRKAQIN